MPIISLMSNELLFNKFLVPLFGDIGIKWTANVFPRAQRISGYKEIILTSNNLITLGSAQVVIFQIESRFLRNFLLSIVATIIDFKILYLMYNFSLIFKNLNVLGKFISEFQMFTARYIQNENLLYFCSMLKLLYSMRLNAIAVSLIDF
uniref:Uncharacterized protein n=1 Tax=Strigamia maritima TaxID=126957 RepID=T1JIQ9_STRMM